MHVRTVSSTGSCIVLRVSTARCLRKACLEKWRRKDLAIQMSDMAMQKTKGATVETVFIANILDKLFVAVRQLRGTPSYLFEVSDPWEPLGRADSLPARQN